MQLKFIKQIDFTKYYSLRDINDAISLTVTHKPNFELIVWFEYEGIVYDHKEFSGFEELESYIKKISQHKNYIFLVDINDGACTYAYIDKEEQNIDVSHVMKQTVKKIAIIDYDNYSEIGNQNHNIRKITIVRK